MPREKFYCGDHDDVPNEYTRRGSRLECLRRGFGAGMYSEINKHKPEEKKDNDTDSSSSDDDDDNEHKYDTDEEDTDEEKEKKWLKEEKRELRDPEKYVDFTLKNFNKAKRKAKKLEDIFKELAILWKIEHKMKGKKK